MTNTGTSGVTISAVRRNDAAFNVVRLSLPLTIPAGQSVHFDVAFDPRTSGDLSTEIAFTGEASGQTLYLPVRGSGVNKWALAATPPSLAFGDVQVGSNRTLPVTVINADMSPVSISRGGISGAGFSVRGVSLPIVLAPGESFTFDVIFAPPMLGAIEGSITATNPTTSALTIPLSGTGTAAGTLIDAPTTMNFGDVKLGSSGWQTGTLSATGASVTVYSANIDDSEFTLSGLNFPLIIGPGQSVPYTVGFTPQSTGNASAGLSFYSNAADSPIVESLDGYGQAPQSYTVSLSWQPSESQVVGYNVFRGTTSGGPYAQINSTLDPDTNYVDNGVAGGETYYYVTTAVNSSGQQSGYSNQAKVLVP